MNRFNLIFLLTWVLNISIFAQDDTTKIPDFIDIGEARLKIFTTQWATKVISFSSEYSPTIHSAKQVLGKPNALPVGGSAPTAWTHNKKAKDGKEFIRVGFEYPQKIQQVAIGENYKPGAIEKIVLYGKNKEELVVFQGEAHLIKEPYRMFNVFLMKLRLKLQNLNYN